VAIITVKKILIPIDFSENSSRVLDFGRTIADACDASLHLLHVIGGPLVPPDTLRRERREICGRLEALLEARDRDVRHATTFCAAGTPAAEIVRFAADHGIDLIVMGTHRHGPTFQMAAASIAEEVMRLAPCAVLAVKGAEKDVYEAAFDPVAATSPC
jgi:nucleotide-binding universal stress UspA family protein